MRELEQVKGDEDLNEQMRLAVFLLVTLVTYKIIARGSWLYSDEVFLIAACVGVTLAGWLWPIVKGNRRKGIILSVVAVLGAYFFVLKLPGFLSGWVDYQLATIGCAIAFASCYWFFVMRKFKRMA